MGKTLVVAAALLLAGCSESMTDEQWQAYQVWQAEQWQAYRVWQAEQWQARQAQQTG